MKVYVMPIEIQTADGMWVCMRPGRFATELEYSVQEQGLREAGWAIFSEKYSDVFRDSKGQVWTKKLLNETQMCEKVLKNPEWYLECVKRRCAAYQKINSSLEDLQLKLRHKQSAKSLEKELCLDDYIGKFINLFTDFYTYIHLGLFDEMLIEGFSIFLQQHLSNALANKCMEPLLHSDYAANFYKAGFKMDEIKSINLAQKDFIPVIHGHIDLEKHSSVDPKIYSIFTQKSLLSVFLNYCIVVPLAYQLGQENLFIGKPLISSFSFLLTEIGELLVSKSLIKDKLNLSSLSFQEITLLLRDEKMQLVHRY